MNSSDSDIGLLHPVDDRSEVRWLDCQLFKPARPEDDSGRERRSAQQALGGVVTVDTSVAAVAAHADLDLRRLASLFKRVLVADALVADARNAVTSTSLPKIGQAAREPVAGELTLTNTETHTAQTRDTAKRVVEHLERFRSVPSGGLGTPWADQTSHFHPWDASLRVALDKGCALWCDDAALRRWAEQEGIACFGTYTLYETLDQHPDLDAPAGMDDIKRSLIKAGIADIALRWQEIGQIDAEDPGGPATIHFLARPSNWCDLQQALGWYRDRFDQAAGTPEDGRVLHLLWAASYGSGIAAPPKVRRLHLGGLLAMAAHRLHNPEIVPYLVYQSRSACSDIHPEGGLDVLSDAVDLLLRTYLSEFDPAAATQAVVNLFAQCKDSDRAAVASAVLASRAGPLRALPAPSATSVSPKVRGARPTMDDARRAAEALRSRGARQVLVFGSVAQNTSAESSDIDLVAVFDDLGDYRDRPGIEAQATSAAEKGCGWRCDVIVTDRVEWAIRSQLTTTVEAEVARTAKMLLDLPVAARVNWDKHIVRPSSDIEEVKLEVEAAALHARAISDSVHRAVSDSSGADATRSGISRRDRMIGLCKVSYLAISAALRVYTKGALRQRPSLDPGRGRVESMLINMPSPERQRTQQILSVPPDQIDAWQQKPGHLLASATLASATPQLAGAMALSALSCCEFAARSISTAPDLAEAAQALLAEATNEPTIRALETVRAQASSPIAD